MPEFEAFDSVYLETINAVTGDREIRSGIIDKVFESFGTPYAVFTDNDGHTINVPQSSLNIIS